MRQSKRLAAEAKLTKLIASSQENRLQWRGDVLTAHERCQSWEEQLREARRGSTKLTQATRQLDHVQRTLGIAQEQATLAGKSAQDSHQKLIIMEQKSKKCSNILSTSRQTRTQWRADLLKAQQKIQSLEEQLREAKRGSTKLTQMTRHLDQPRSTHACNNSREGSPWRDIGSKGAGKAEESAAEKKDRKPTFETTRWYIYRRNNFEFNPAFEK